MVTCAEVGEMEIDTELAERMITVADADFEASATDLAVTVANEGLGTEPGAVYRPDDEIAPQDPPTQPVPETDHFTAVLPEPVTVEKNCCLPFTPRVTLVGEMATATLAGVPILTLAVPDFVVS